MKPINVAALLLAAICGCAFRAPEPSYARDSSMPFAEARSTLFKQAVTCWPRRPTPFRDGISVSPNDPSPSEFEVKLYRWTAGGTLNRPFLVVILRQADKGTEVRVSEGDYSCNLAGTCKPLGLSQHVDRWLSADLSCPPIDTSSW